MSLDGRSVLQEGDSNVPHHHGMSLGFRVNGLSFWGEYEGSGWQRSGREIDRRVGRDARGRFFAEVGHTVYWVPAEEGLPRVNDAWLVEDRRIRFLVDESTGEVAVGWQSAFTVGELAEGTNVEIEVAEGEGWVLGLTPEFRQVVVTPSKVQTNAVPLLPGAGGLGGWVSLAGEIEGRPLTLTTYSETRKGEAPQWTHAPEQPAWLSVRPEPPSRSNTLGPGERLDLRFLVTAHLRRMTPKELAARLADWLGELRRDE
jgi:hypothetical protein